MIRFTCPKCHKSFQVADQTAGKKAKCSKCNATMRIPSPSGEDAIPDLFSDNASSFLDDEILPSSIPATDSGTSSWAPQPNESRVEAVCHKCGYTWVFGESHGGQFGLCNNCGDLILIPTLKQAQYAKQQAQNAKRSQKTTRNIVLLFVCVFVGMLSLVFLGVVIHGNTPMGRAEWAAVAFTEHFVKRDLVRLRENNVVESKPNGLYLVKVTWEEKAIADSVTIYVAVAENAAGECKIGDFSVGSKPLGWEFSFDK